MDGGFLQLSGVPICCAVDWRLAGMPLSCCGSLVDWEDVVKAVIRHLILPRNLVAMIVGLFGGSTCCGADSPDGALVGRCGFAGVGGNKGGIGAAAAGMTASRIASA